MTARGERPHRSDPSQAPHQPARRPRRPVVWDLTVIGGGIVGLAAALQITERDPSLRVGVVEKEPEVGTHQTGRNSGVVHSGAYYRPGSLKARLCVDGARRLLAFCEARDLPRRRLGKLIVALDDGDLPRLEELHRRAVANGVGEVGLLDRAGMGAIEPEVAGVAALHLPEVSIVDFRAVAEAMADELRRRGVIVDTGWPVTGIRPAPEGLILSSPAGERTTRRLVNCAGLYSDEIARMTGIDPGLRIVPFRGEYRLLASAQARRVRGLVYPVPDPRFPFLGVHLTPMLDGGVEAGPNAVLALRREGYRRRDVRWSELWPTLRYPGFRRLVRAHWRMGLGELRGSLSRRAFAAAVARLLPGVRARDLRPGGAGVRAQAIRPDGTLEDDFAVVVTDDAVHVLNAPSPAATAALAIGDHIAEAVLR
jgi:(S)-2-hydroxyglutarate dehydrogenase